MMVHTHNKLKSSIFITFSGNCKEALRTYQDCFGGELQFETFEKEVQGFMATPVVSGSLVSDRIIIHGSDLVHNEGRKLGNYISIFLHCKNAHDRSALIRKLDIGRRHFFLNDDDDSKLIEVVDAFDVRWILGI